MSFGYRDNEKKPCGGGPTTNTGIDNYLDVNGLRLHYVEWGDRAAPPLVLLHGMASFARIWDFIVPAFEAEYRVLALDWRGHGDSAWAPAGEYSYQHYISDLHGLISALDLHDVAIVAHSLGAWIALCYAGQAPAKLRAVAAADFRIGFSAEELEQARVQSLRPPREFATPTEILDRFGASLAPLAAPDAVIRRLGEHAIKQTAAGPWTFKFDRAALAAAPFDPWRLFSSLRVPILALRGMESPLMSHDAMVRVGQAIPDVRIAELAGAYHHLFLDRPDPFIRAVKSFLRDNPVTTKRGESV